jgi:hypothetical protein
MKSVFKFVFAFTFVLGFMIGVAHADTGSAVTSLQMPGWVVSVIKELENIPAIGHILVAIIGVLAVATPILTALSALLMGIQKAFNIAGLLPEINFLNQKLIPWVAMFSNLNVQPASAPNLAPTVAVAPVVAATAVSSTPSTPSS